MCVWQWSYIKATKVHLGQFCETDFLDLKVQEKLLRRGIREITAESS